MKYPVVFIGKNHYMSYSKCHIRLIHIEQTQLRFVFRIDWVIAEWCNYLSGTLISTHVIHFPNFVSNSFGWSNKPSQPRNSPAHVQTYIACLFRWSQNAEILSTKFAKVREFHKQLRWTQWLCTYTPHIPVQGFDLYLTCNVHAE